MAGCKGKVCGGGRGMAEAPAKPCFKQYKIY